MTNLAPTLERSPQRQLEDDIAVLRLISQSGAEDESEVNWSSLLPGIDGFVTLNRFKRLHKLLDKTPREFGQVSGTARHTAR